MQNRDYPPRGGNRRPSGAPPRRPSGVRPEDYRPRSSVSGASRGSASGRPRPAAQSRTNSRPAASRNDPRAKRNAPRRPRRRFRINPVRLIVTACVVALLVYVVRFAMVLGVGTPKFVRNVYINNVSLAGSTHDEGIAHMRELEQEWLNTVYTLQYQSHSWTFTRASVEADIDYESQLEYAWNIGHVGTIFERKNVIERLNSSPIYMTAAVSYDEALLDAFIDGICAEIDEDAVDAVVVADVSAPVVLTESKTGRKVNREQLKQQLVALIKTGESDTAVPVETVFPTVNSDAVSFQTIANFSTNTDFRGSASLSNVRLALNAFNGMEVLPGQTVSFNSVVGPRTEAAGFKKATEFAGDTTTYGVGGGVCQASTTLYNALVMANMTVLDRKPHSMTVSYVDPSCDAAVTEAGDGKDLVFQNNTEYPIYIYTTVTSELATVTIYGHQPEYFYHLESVIVQEDVPATRRVYIDDNEGTHVYYKDDEPQLQSQGKPGCVSQGWVVAYDWNTREEVSRTQVSSDHYRAGASTYWRGTHDRNEVGRIPEY